MIVTKKNEFGALQVEELKDFELVNEIELPAEYKKFLLENNGGKPVLNYNAKTDNTVAYIFGMHNGEFYASLYSHIEMLKNRIPFSSFPIANDYFGNLFLMSVHPESYGQIFFWDHEKSPKYLMAIMLIIALLFQILFQTLSTI